MRLCFQHDDGRWHWCWLVERSNEMGRSADINTDVKRIKPWTVIREIEWKSAADLNRKWSQGTVVSRRIMLDQVLLWSQIRHQQRIRCRSHSSGKKLHCIGWKLGGCYYSLTDACLVCVQFDSTNRFCSKPQNILFPEVKEENESF